MKIDKAMVVGCGGTGSHLIDPLTRMLAFHTEGTKDITVVDGDSFEASNSERQIFSESVLGMNKAMATAKRLEPFTVEPMPEFITAPKFYQATVNAPGTLLVVTAVDNHATREAIIRTLTSEEYQNFIFVSPGNDYSHGQSVVWVRRDGRDRTVHPFVKYPDLREPEDQIPGIGCAEEAESTPQLITANASSALTVLLTVQAVLDDAPVYEEVHFDCLKMKIAPQGAPIDMSQDESSEENVQATSIFENSLF